MLKIFGFQARSSLIAVAIDCWPLQFLEIAELIVNWVDIAIAIASTLTALNWFEDCFKSVEASTFTKNVICMRHAHMQIHCKVSVVLEGNTQRFAEPLLGNGRRTHHITYYDTLHCITLRTGLTTGFSFFDTHVFSWSPLQNIIIIIYPFSLFQ